MPFHCVVLGEQIQDARSIPDYESDCVRRAEHHAASWHGETLTDAERYALTGKVERRCFARGKHL